MQQYLLIYKLVSFGYTSSFLFTSFEKHIMINVKSFTILTQISTFLCCN